MTFDTESSAQQHIPSRKNAASEKRITTLGEQLEQEARTLASRRFPRLAWLPALNTVQQHLESLQVLSHTRFQRSELPSSALPVHPVAPVSQELFTGQADAQQPQQASLLYGKGQAQGERLPFALQQRLESFLGEDARHVRVHHDATADELARAHQADAVTVGQDIFFKRGRFSPHTDNDFALLTHEAMHVVQAMRPNASWQRATQKGIQEHEQEALMQERRVLATKRGEPGGAALLAPRSPFPAQRATPAVQHAPSVALPSLPSSTPAQRPMAASVDRVVDPLFESRAKPEQVNADREQLQRQMYRELMRQMRIDQERGG